MNIRTMFVAFALCFTGLTHATSFDFTAADGTTLETYDSRFDGSTTAINIQSNTLRVITANEVQRPFYFVNGQPAAQACQMLIGPNLTGSTWVSVQKNGSQVGYDARPSGTNVLEIRENGTYRTEGSISGGNFTTTGYSVKIAVDGGGVVRVWAAAGNVADAEVSGTLIATFNDVASPLTGGYPGGMISAQTLTTNTQIDNFNDFYTPTAGIDGDMFLIF